MKGSKFAVVLALATLASSFQAAEAATATSPATSLTTVLISQNKLVAGNQASVIALSIPSAGQLTLSLSDLKFPDYFSSLTLGVTDATHLFGYDIQTPQNGQGAAATFSLLSTSVPGTLTFNVTGPTTLYADVFANAGGAANVGLYNLTGTFVAGAAPVPLPAGGMLLAGGLLLLVAASKLRPRCFQLTVINGMV